MDKEVLNQIILWMLAFMLTFIIYYTSHQHYKTNLKNVTLYSLVVGFIFEMFYWAIKIIL